MVSLFSSVPDSLQDIDRKQLRKRRSTFRTILNLACSLPKWVSKLRSGSLGISSCFISFQNHSTDIQWGLELLHWQENTHGLPGDSKIGGRNNNTKLQLSWFQHRNARPSNNILQYSENWFSVSLQRLINEKQYILLQVSWTNIHTPVWHSNLLRSRTRCTEHVAKAYMLQLYRLNYWNIKPKS